jgi:hypothetical protein
MKRRYSALAMYAVAMGVVALTAPAASAMPKESETAAARQLCKPSLVQGGGQRVFGARICAVQRHLQLPVEL